MTYTDSTAAGENIRVDNDTEFLNGNWYPQGPSSEGVNAGSGLEYPGGLLPTDNDRPTVDREGRIAGDRDTHYATEAPPARSRSPHLPAIRVGERAGDRLGDGGRLCTASSTRSTRSLDQAHPGGHGVANERLRLHRLHRGARGCGNAVPDLE